MRNNFQSLLTVGHVPYDAGQTRHAVQSAELSRQMSGEGRAAVTRPEVRQIHLAADLAKTQIDSARSALSLQEAFHAPFEANRQKFVKKGRANWLASVGLHSHGEVTSVSEV